MSDKALSELQDKAEEASINAQDWYDRWRERIHSWVGERIDPQIADLVLALPDMVMLLVGLVGDQRVPIAVKARIALALAYVFSPWDLIPEAVLGLVGLTDDAGVLVVMLFTIHQLGSIDRKLLSDYWRGQNDAMETITSLHSWLDKNAESLLGSTWQTIQRFFGNKDKSAE